MLHVLHVLMWGFHHIKGVRCLFRFYLHHHAVAFLRPLKLFLRLF